MSPVSDPVSVVGENESIFPAALEVESVLNNHRDCPFKCWERLMALSDINPITISKFIKALVRVIEFLQSELDKGSDPNEIIVLGDLPPIDDNSLMQMLPPLGHDENNEYVSWQLRVSILTEIQGFADEVGMDKTRVKAMDMRVRLLSGVPRKRLLSDLDKLKDDIEFESSQPQFLLLDPDRAELWTAKPNLYFGQEVWDRYSSARYDLRESLRCLAVGRGTACVSHLMRALEPFMASVWFCLHPSHNRMNPRNPRIKIKGLGEYHSLIKDWIAKPANTAKASDWDQKKEVIAHLFERLGSVKDTRRNAVAHAERHYEEAEAKEVLGAVKALVTYAARHMDDRGNFV